MSSQSGTPLPLQSGERSYAPMSTTGGVPLPVSGVFGSSVKRRQPSRSVGSPAAAALFPASMQGEPAASRALSSAVPGTPSGPSASRNTGSLLMLPAPGQPPCTQLQVTAAPAKSSICGPAGAEFPQKIEFVIVKALRFSTAPPPPASAQFPANVQPVSARYGPA